MVKTFDSLSPSASIFYERPPRTKKQIETRNTLDDAGKILFDNALRADYKTKAKTQGWLRRTYSRSYLNRSDDGGKIYMETFDQIGFRYKQVLSAGWYTDDFCQDTINGVVLAVGRHTPTPDQYGNTYGDWHEVEGKGVFMAGTKHSDCDGVTLYVDTFDTFADAERFANGRAELEAEECREEDAKYRREEAAHDLKSTIRDTRIACLKLLRDMRPIRKGLTAFPDSVCSILREQVQRYCQIITDSRAEIHTLEAQ